MPSVRTYINSDTHTTEQAFGLSFDSAAISTLMTPPPLKDYISRKSPLTHGKQVLHTPDSPPRLNERDLQLTFTIRAASLAQFLTRYRALCDELSRGALTITIEIAEGGTSYRQTFALLYLSCNQYTQFNGRLAKFTIKLNEPNPANRPATRSADID